ncbi:hypothetical protein CKJ76_05685 [Mycobacterium avium]|uniref:DUF6542 domain-containing protein n=1 Tax=Mycobacterium avium subsp. hominissuis TaxID=439334 RepID=A0A3B6XAT0_MYCAV|nr:hypothetical protein DFS55_19225 [Mycobacterium avium subsp. hominissuis]PBA72608.1 hypothetical protein CKJ76_05685 [Mycobacterium avium]
MESAHRSIHPNIPGLPWYAAVLVAVTATAIGYGIDAGHKELTHVFAGFYIAGCVAAVLAVRQDGIFTTIIQPPLILFCAVPGAYWLFHDAKVGRLKDLLINCGYPLIERFPLMLGTAGAVLAIGLVRWYFGHGQRSTTAAGSDDAAAGPTVDVQSLVGGLVAKVRAALHPDSDGDTTEESAQRRRTRRSGSSSRTRRTARSTRSSASSSRTRSRHARPPLDDAAEPAERPERPRRATRRSAASARNYDTAGRNYDAAEPPRRTRRRPRPDADPELRGQTPREPRREPRPRRSPYERPVPRSSRFDGYDPPSGPENLGRYDSRYDTPEPPYEPRRRRPASTGANGTHHPISQVRYRGAAAPGQPREPHTERRTRSRTPGRTQGRPPAESWEYDA